VLFRYTAGRDRGVFRKERLKAYAADAGIADLPRFDRCVDGGGYEALVRQEAERARALGVTGTPTLFADRRRIAPLPATFEELWALVRGGR
jgi:protein-disulfide isomerase